MNSIEVGKARITDAGSMHQLINHFADKGDMLPRALSEIYENIRDYFVARDKDGIIGCAALHVNWLDLAEIKSLAVNERNHNKGIGSLLVKACIEEAKELGIPTVFCLARSYAFFEKNEFLQTDKMGLPRKVWVECYRCPKFPDCDEVALIRHI